MNVCAVFDNEEVGSLSKQGADSTLLGDVLTRALCALGLSDAQIRAALAASFMVSADNAHAVHPNHPEKYDDLNRTVMNGGVVIKHNANQKYTTDAVSDAIFSEICAKAGRAGSALRQPLGYPRRLDARQPLQRARIHEHRGYRPGSACDARQL